MRRKVTKYDFINVSLVQILYELNMYIFIAYIVITTLSLRFRYSRFSLDLQSPKSYLIV